MRLIERQKNFMSTTITIKVVQIAEPTVKINSAIEEAFGEFDRIVKQYTRFNENSELSNLNRQAGSWVKVSEEFCTLVNKMLKLSRASDGAFDPTVIDFLEIYGYDPNYDFSKLNNPKLNEIIADRVKKRSSWQEIKVDLKRNRIKLAQDQRIDLGGIGKGYAIDCAANKLLAVSSNFLIDGGGDICAHGLNIEGMLWRAALKVKKNNIEEIIGEVELNNSSIASSGSWARKFKQFHHLINPRTGKPHTVDYSTVFVQAVNSTESDGWATALFIGGRELAEKLPMELKVLFV